MNPAPRLAAPPGGQDGAIRPDRPSALRGALLVLGTGQVLVFFSETLFFAHWRPAEDSASSRLVTWLAYALLAYPVLAAIATARLHDAWGLVLAGAFFGWLAEGAIAGTLYGDRTMPFPFTVAWTALAWHMPLSLLAGWWWLGLALRARRPWPSLAWAIGLGLLWGAWGFSWRFNDPPLAMPHPDFLWHAVMATLGLVLGHVAVALGRPASFRPGRGPLLAAAVALAAALAGLVMPRVPWAPLLLAPLLAGAWLLMRRAGAAGRGAPVLAALSAPPRPLNLAMLAALPFTAAATLHGLEGAGLDVPTHPLLVLAGMTGGSLALAAASWRALRRGTQRCG